jgi:hypothetical protein
MADFIPKIALDYIKNKKLTPAFSYKDVWHEEHATGFTVAKAMQLDVLGDLHNSVTAAIESGQSFETFKKNIKPVLQQKGWWGKTKMTDPLTGKEVNAQLGSDRRLKTIYSVNMRSAYQKEQYEQTMKSAIAPVPDVPHRPKRPAPQRTRKLGRLDFAENRPVLGFASPAQRLGLQMLYPRRLRGVFEKYKEQGVNVPPSADGTGGGTLEVKTEAPPVNYTTYFNERKGTVEKVPEGIDPAFNWNPGKARTNAAAQKLAESKKNYEAAASAKPGASQCG